MSEAISCTNCFFHPTATDPDACTRCSRNTSIREVVQVCVIVAVYATACALLAFLVSGASPLESVEANADFAIAEIPVGIGRVIVQAEVSHLRGQVQQRQTRVVGDHLRDRRVIDRQQGLLDFRAVLKRS